MYEISIERTFASSHALRGYQGKCEHLHGHNYRVRVTLEGGQLDEAGLLVDFGDLKRVVSSIAEYLDHRHINDLPPFDVLNPTAENMARYFHEEIEKRLPELAPGRDVHLQEVRIWETDTSVAAYRSR